MIIQVIFFNLTSLIKNCHLALENLIRRYDNEQLSKVFFNHCQKENHVLRQTLGIKDFKYYSFSKLWTIFKQYTRVF